MSIAISNNPEENKLRVLEGLQRRSDLHAAFENDMIEAVHKNCARSKEQRTAETAVQSAFTVTDEERKAREKARMEALQKAQKQDQDVSRAVNTYLVTIDGLLLLAALTHFPYWAAITMMLGLGVILAVHIYRIFEPLEVGEK